MALFSVPGYLNLFPVAHFFHSLCLWNSHPSLDCKMRTFPYRKERILISVDHKWRDLPGYVYAGMLLEKLGYRVVLIRNGFEEYYADILNPKAIVMAHLYDRRKSELITRLRQRNILIILMPTEGIPTLEGVRKLAAGYFSDLSGVELHFLWNEQMRRLMQEGRVIEPEKLCVTGVPRFDFYVPPLKNILLTREHFTRKYNIENDLPIITWATNFTNAGFYRENMEFLKKDWNTLQVDRVLNPEEIARKDYISRQIHFEAILKLIRELKDVNVLLKLHPSEDHNYYYDRVRHVDKNLRNRARIINQEYIWDVLNVSDILLERSCTTGVEAWLLGKPTIELRLNPDEWYYSKEHAAGSDEVASYNELKDRVEFYLNNGEISQDLLAERKKFIDKWCYKVDGEATKRFVSKIDETIRRNGKSIVRTNMLTKNFAKSLLLTSLMETTNFRLHNLKVYGLGARVDKLQRHDKYFDRKDETAWRARLSPVLT